MADWCLWWSGGECQLEAGCLPRRWEMFSLRSERSLVSGLRGLKLPDATVIGSAHLDSLTCSHSEVVAPPPIHSLMSIHHNRPLSTSWAQIFYSSHSTTSSILHFKSSPHHHRPIPDRTYLKPLRVGITTHYRAIPIVFISHFRTVISASRYSFFTAYYYNMAAIAYSEHNCHKLENI